MCCWRCAPIFSFHVRPSPSSECSTPVCSEHSGQTQTRRSELCSRWRATMRKPPRVAASIHPALHAQGRLARQSAPDPRAAADISHASRSPPTLAPALVTAYEANARATSTCFGLSILMFELSTRPDRVHHAPLSRCGGRTQAAVHATRVQGGPGVTGCQPHAGAAPAAERAPTWTLSPYAPVTPHWRRQRWCWLTLPSLPPISPPHPKSLPAPHRRRRRDGATAHPPPPVCLLHTTAWRPDPVAAS